MEINDFMEDATRLARWFNRYNNHDRSELYSAALLGATQGVRWIEEGRCNHDNKRAYVLATMKRFIREFIEQNHLIVVPVKKVRAYRKANQDYKLPLIFTTTQTYNSAYSLNMDDDGEFNDDLVRDPLNLRSVAPNQSQRMEFNDLCDQFQLTEFEIQVVKQKLCGMGLMLIGKELGCSHMTVDRALKSIKTKLKGLYDAHTSNQAGHTEGQKTTTNGIK